MKEEKRQRPNLELKITGDGSHTLFVPSLNEHYHSVFGSIAESRHIFTGAGFKYLLNRQSNLKILEIGFGTGLNAMLTYIESDRSGSQVEYTAVELNPLDENIYSKLNFNDLIDYPGSRAIFLLMHESPWEETVEISPVFHLHKINISLMDYQPSKETFDLVYFDAFGPDIQPEMWTEEIFIKMALGLKKGGVLVTYSTKGTVKRNLVNAGFSIEKLPGPKGKREILRATKI